MTRNQHSTGHYSVVFENIDNPGYTITFQSSNIRAIREHISTARGRAKRAKLHYIDIVPLRAITAGNVRQKAGDEFLVGKLKKRETSADINALWHVIRWVNTPKRKAS